MKTDWINSLIVVLTFALSSSSAPGQGQALPEIEIRRANGNDKILEEIMRRVEDIAVRQGIDSRSDSCDDGCSCPECRSSLSIGVEATFMRPTYSPRDKYRDFSRHLKFAHELSPRVCLSHVGPSRFGTRARYWQFNHTSNVYQGAAFRAFRALELHELDVEATYSWNNANWSCLVAGGLRYFDSKYALAFFNPSGGGINSEEQLTHSHGVGPTLALELVAPLGYREGLAFYVNGRISIVGSDTNYATIFGGLPYPIVQESTQEYLLVMNELQTGVQYSHTLGPTLIQTRIGMEGHVWSTRAPIDQALLTDERFGFVGFTISAGISW